MVWGLVEEGTALGVLTERNKETGLKETQRRYEK